MSIWSFALLITSVSLSAAAQLLMKAGVMSDIVQRSIVSGNGLLNIIVAVITSPFVLYGLISFALSVIAWLYVLSKIDVSQAYPVVALGIVITSLGGFLLFGEVMNVMRVLGIVVIVFGVVIVAAS